jgi:hypothetical protein
MSKQAIEVRPVHGAYTDGIRMFLSACALTYISFDFRRFINFERLDLASYGYLLAAILLLSLCAYIFHLFLIYMTTKVVLSSESIVESSSLLRRSRVIPLDSILDYSFERKFRSSVTRLVVQLEDRKTKILFDKPCLFDEFKKEMDKRNI